MLGRKPGKTETICRRLAATVVCALLGAGSAFAAEDPLDHCWEQAGTRIELEPCLEKLLRDAEDRLWRAHSNAVREARALDRVTGGQSKNLTHTLQSDSRWRGYRRSECDRRAQAMSPGTGGGDVFLACMITLTNERLEHLGMH